MPGHVSGNVHCTQSKYSLTTCKSDWSIHYEIFGADKVFSWADGTKVTAVRATEDYSDGHHDGHQKWISNEGYEIKLPSLSQVPNQNQGCTLQMHMHFGYL